VVLRYYVGMNMNAPVGRLEYFTPPPLPTKSALPSLDRSFAQLDQYKVNKAIREQEKLDQLKVDDTWEAAIGHLDDSMEAIGNIKSATDDHDIEDICMNLDALLKRITVRFKDKEAQSVGWWRKVHLSFLLSGVKDMLFAAAHNHLLLRDRKILEDNWTALEKICNS